MGINFGKWIGNAVKTIGKPISLAGHALQSATGAITHEIDKIPVIGKPFSAVLDSAFIATFGPLEATGQILDGRRIDMVILGQLKSELDDFKAAGPYAQMVVSFIPGIGTGISAAIGAGLALANGQPISQAMVAAIKGAVPGGPAASAVFDVAQQTVKAAANHTKVTWDLVASMAGSAGADLASLPQAAKDALVATLSTAGALSRGERPDIALADGALQAAQNQIPVPIVKALQVGMAVAHAKAIQTKKQPAIVDRGTVGKLIALGRSVAMGDPIVSTARKTLKDGYNGFDIGMGLVQLAANTNDVLTLRNSLAPVDQKAFDLALSLHIGRVAHPTPANIQNVGGQAAYFATMGMQGAQTASKVSAMAGLASQPSTNIGARVAVDTVMMNRGTAWQRFVHWLRAVFVG